MSKSVMFKVQRHRASIYFDVSRPGGDYPGGKEGQFPELPVQKDKGPDYAKESFHSFS